MKRVRWLVLVGAVALAVGLTGMFCGCEDTPSMADLDSFFAAHPTFPDPRVPGNKPLTVVPDPSPAVVQYVGDTVSLLVLGGPSEYEWWVVDESVGRFIQGDAHSDTVVYEALLLADNTVYVMDSRGRAAVVHIQATPNSATLTIDPTSAIIPTNIVATVDFQVFNGVPPYTWSVTFAQMGTIVPDGNGETARYTSNKGFGGDNGVTVRDSRGDYAKATVNHSK